MKKVVLFSTLILCLMVSATFVKAESTESIYNKLQVNASCDGDLFKVGIMGNYYKITTSASCSYTQNQKIIPLSSKITLNKNYESTELTINKNFKNDITILMSGDLPKGYCELIFKFLNIHPDGVSTTWDTGNNTTNNTKFNNFYNNQTYYSPYYESINQTYTILNKPNYSYCTMYLYADIIKTTFYFEQYQQWWFGNQKLWDSNIDVIILNNMRRVTIYE